LIVAVSANLNERLTMGKRVQAEHRELLHPLQFTTAALCVCDRLLLFILIKIHAFGFDCFLVADLQSSQHIPSAVVHTTSRALSPIAS
jgi:hypothetical protein